MNETHDLIYSYMLKGEEYQNAKCKGDVPLEGVLWIWEFLKYVAKIPLDE